MPRITWEAVSRMGSSERGSTDFASRIAFSSPRSKVTCSASVRTWSSRVFMRASSDAAAEDCAAGTSFFGSSEGVCWAEATEEQQKRADRITILFMALLLTDRTDRWETQGL